MNILTTNKHFRSVLAGLCLLVSSHCAMAADCFDMAGKDAGIDPDLLRAIAWQESRLNYDAIGKNPGTGYGMGLMQIDSQHLGNMKKRGIDRELLVSDICTNIYSGALILAKAFNKWGATWEAVGAYNAGFAGTPKQHVRRMAYARKIYATYWKLKKGEDSR
ncbi:MULTISPECIES: transglycosylase SLT domain-containing protein [Salmonella]|uniref:transglycosylase SLT domain-containing protein n=2 Tax=Enterobacteriaceae TaxID=543 RepID=UPI0002BC7621|nr:lytic transglycosylase [Salmonella enterica]ECM8012253.1 transglycosylase SLT domain-containing protein [Salmonella enterica subsp. enterica serovar Newport]EMG72197.1 lytic transglycosylase-like protein [Salmonella enterica subsp. enterica serovar Newport str. Shandong_3]EBU0430684.1 lytic transglycosylase [Salmonella enterica]ECV9049692.1 transglycosylase SLT domain-containing protein [Salmonella enterica subsp. enterica serovar Newport]